MAEASGFGAGIGAASGLIGGLLQLQGAREANAANSDMANRQMDFQRAMSGTAHQREVADLRAAGLNPILSANAGASTPSGASATMTNALEGLGSSIANTGKNYAEYSQAQRGQNSQIGVNEANIEATKAQQKLAEIKQTSEANTAKVLQEQASQKAMETQIIKAGMPARMKMAPVQPYIDAASQGLGMVTETLGGAFLGKKLMGGAIDAIKPGQGLLKDGSKFNLDTGEILRKR